MLFSTGGVLHNCLSEERLLQKTLTVHFAFKGPGGQYVNDGTLVDHPFSYYIYTFQFSECLAALSIWKVETLNILFETKEK